MTWLVVQGVHWILCFSKISGTRRSTHTDTDWKPRKTESGIYIWKSSKNTIFNEHPVPPAKPFMSFTTEILYVNSLDHSPLLHPWVYNGPTWCTVLAPPVFLQFITNSQNSVAPSSSSSEKSFFPSSTRTPWHAIHPLPLKCHISLLTTLKEKKIIYNKSYRVSKQ